MRVRSNKRFFKRIAALGLSLSLMGNMIPQVCAANGNRDDSMRTISGVEYLVPTKGLRDVHIAESYNYVSDLPIYYRDQLLSMGYSQDTELVKVASLKIDTNSKDTLVWLNRCTFLIKLDINFTEMTDKLVLVNKLPNLKTVSVSCMTTKTYNNYTDWEKDRVANYSKNFLSLGQSGYSSNNKEYFHAVVSDVELTPELMSFLVLCPTSKVYI